MSRLRGRWGLAGFVALVALVTAAETLPAPWHLGTRILTNHGDPGLLMWQLTTQSHALAAGRVGDLLQGNIFYPHRDVLAYSDSLLAYLPVFALALGLSGNPILAYNTTLFLGYLAGAAAMYALARHLLGRGWPSSLATVLFSACTLRAATIDHLQLVGIAFVLLAVLFLLRLLESARWRDAAGLGMAVGLAWLGSAYCAMMLAIGLPAFLVVWWARRHLRFERRLALRLAAALGLAALLALPTLPAYLAVQRSGAEARADTAIEGIGPSSFTTLPPSPVYRALGVGARVLPEQDALFPGAVVVALCLVTVVLGVRGRRSQPAPGREVSRRHEFAWPAAALVMVQLAVMVGPRAPGPIGIPDRLLRAVVPGLVSVRGLGRLWLPAAALLAIAAAVGAKQLLARAGRAQLTIVVALLLLAPLEMAVPQPEVGFDLGPTRAAANIALRDLPVGPVMEMPALQPGPAYAETIGPRQVRSTIDGLPRVEGRSGAVPADSAAMIVAARSFPDPLVVDMMRRAGVRYVVLHAGDRACADLYSPDELAALLAILSASPYVEGVVRATPDAIILLRPLRPGEASLSGPLPAPVRRPATPCADP